MRGHRRRHSQLRAEERLRANARSYANVYERRGLLLRQPCRVCGDPAAEKHHHDYAKPLDVDWLCRVHHLAAHAEGPEKASRTPHTRV